ncbi:hypothetical protein C1645_821175 [Glomus cerebriforme]|uniref:Uncharacterized protein n=1 Tax=Glomus cerebriforme TaxID=658196 RepID=A0A397T6W7_9GLOM|nr:hypothetical protein C1645_821175 [Glomus cerebriforme]
MRYAEKNSEHARELLTWIQKAIKTKKLLDPVFTKSRIYNAWPFNKFLKIILRQESDRFDVENNYAINGNSLVNDLKEIIKKKNMQTFANNSDKLLIIRKILKYFLNLPVEEHIHVIVELPISTITLSHKQELLDQLVSLQAVNIEHATLKGLKDSICDMYKLPALENDEVVLNIMNDENKRIVKVMGLEITGFLIENITSLNDLVCLCEGEEVSENNCSSAIVIEDDNECCAPRNNKYPSMPFFLILFERIS